MTTTPRTDLDALVLALKLAITAPTDEKAQQCIEMAETLARGLSPEDVSLAKELASKNPEDLGMRKTVDTVGHTRIRHSPITCQYEPTARKSEPICSCDHPFCLHREAGTQRYEPCRSTGCECDAWFSAEDEAEGAA